MFVVDFEFNIVDDGTYSEYYEDVERILAVVGEDWGSRIDAVATLEIDVSFEFAPSENFLAKAGPITVEPLREENGISIVEIGTIHEIRTGEDPNATQADGQIIFNGALIEEFFWDPAPLERTVTIPDNEYDAYTILLHEVGHVIGFSGYKDDRTGEAPGIMTTYDELVERVGPDDFVFTGANAVEIYGDNVPLALGSLAHYGNPGGPGEDLDELLMSPTIDVEERAVITDIDLAILLDLGVPVIYDGGTAPTPPTPPMIEILGTNRSEIIEVIHTNAAILVNITDVITGRTTRRAPIDSTGFTDFLIRGLGGNDRIFVNNDMLACTIFGDEGDDTIIGGNGSDTLFGNAGNDQIYGGYGEDRIDGGYGRDYLVGGFDNDRIFGDLKDPDPAREPDVNGHDTLEGSAGEDKMYGGAGDDILIGGNNNDRLWGETGNDSLYGADGRDTMDGGAGADLFEGGAGVDIADYAARVANLIISIDEVADDGEVDEGDNVTFSTENVWGGLGNDRIGASGAKNALWGNGGQDTLDGGSGDDFIEGSAGADKIDGMSGRDTIYGGVGADHINGGSDADEIFAGDGNDRIFTTDRHRDVIDGGLGENTLEADQRDEYERVLEPLVVTTR